MRMFSATLRGNVRNRAFQNLQERLLYTFPRNITGDGWVFVFSADFVDFVDVNDALLAFLHIAIGGLQQLEDDVFDILTHITGFGQGRGIDNRERHIQNSS